MRRLKLYLDTCVLNRFVEPGDLRNAVLELFEKIEKGIYEAYISQTVIEEIVTTPISLKQKRSELLCLLDKNLLEKQIIKRLDFLDKNSFERIHELCNKYLVENEYFRGNKYIIEKTWPGSHRKDPFLIATAVVYHMDIFVTVDKDLCKSRIKDLVNRVNKALGYPPIRISLPNEVLHRNKIVGSHLKL